MDEVQKNKLKDQLHEVIFEADTPAGKMFDLLLLVAILASVGVVILESISSIQLRFAHAFYILEWSFTILFTIEYILRLYCVRSPARYAASFYGIVDLLAILPTYLSILIAGTQYLLVIRGLRLLRIFRILKIAHFTREGYIIVRALRESRIKITIFLFFIAIMVLIIGSLMYLVEGGTNEGFSSIPRSIYWAIVTLTTVGFGDITPQTNFGQFISALVMIIGYAVIAVPTGIVSAEMVSMKKRTNTQACRNCGKEGHEDDAEYCKYCGYQLNE